jgi:hypothetical protein
MRRNPKPETRNPESQMQVENTELFLSGFRVTDPDYIKPVP